MFDEYVTIASDSGGTLKASSNAALFLAKKVTAAQREVVQQLRTEAAEHLRADTSRRDAENGSIGAKRDSAGQHTADRPPADGPDTLSGSGGDTPPGDGPRLDLTV